MSIKSANETEGHLLSARDLELFSLDEWQKFTAEAIEIRKIDLRLSPQGHRDSGRVPLIAELVLLILLALSLPLASGLAFPGQASAALRVLSLTAQESNATLSLSI